MAAAGALAGLAGFGLAKWQPWSQTRQADLSGFWARNFPTPEGGSLSMAGLRGQPLLINFWATWCPPCVQELPLLSRFYTENKANGWQVVGLAVDRDDAVRRFLGRAPVSFPVGMAGMTTGVELMRPLGNAKGELPFTVVLDANGQLLGRATGQIDPDGLAAWRQAAAS
jgi:thiol-disulfide isomerase/thioredoxin